MKLTFVTDYVCPFCIIGKAALKEAIKELHLDIEIETLPMELTVEPEPRVDTWNNQEKRSHYTILFSPAKELGIDAKFPPYVVPRPYTRLAWEGHFYAMEQGLSDAYDDAMYRAYFVDERDIGEINVIADVAEKVGLDRAGFIEAVESGAYTEMEKQAVDHARYELNVECVPTLIINGKKILFETYTKEDAMRIIEEKFVK